MERASKEEVLTGRTLQVYVFMTKRGAPVGVRELQRAMGFASPSGASHHLEKLERAGLAERTQEGQYQVKRQVDASVFANYLRLRTLILPRQLFYLIFFSVWLVEYLELSGLRPNLTALLALAAASAGFGFEALRSWRRGPA
jgi:DNA-binding transcriptional ArsR family regulator